MEVFINECSLNNQFEDTYSFIQSVKTFLSSIQLIASIKSEKEVFKSNSFFYYTGISGTYLETSLKSNPQVNRTFVENLQTVNPKKWEQTHDSNSSYFYNTNDYVGTSVAEIAERSHSVANMKGFLLNFKDSQFADSVKIEVLKNNNQTIPVDCAYDADSVNNWLIENEFIKPDEIYNKKSGLAPADIQTVLRDSSIFELTDYKRNNGRKVYRRIGTDELWVVDGASKHAGPKAHMEVFNERTGKHLGTSLYNQINLNIDYMRDRDINLE